MGAMTAKTCTKCGDTKTLSEFHLNNTTRDGLHSRCKDCAKAVAKAHYVANREAKKAYARKHRQETMSATLKRERAYRLANPHVKWEAHYREQSLALGFLPIVVPFAKADLIDRYGDACVHCGGIFEELDHYPVPIALGGAHSLENCVPSCLACNRAQISRIRKERANTF